MATGAKHTPYSIIGGDVAIHGNVEASVDLHIDGKVEGDISCAALVQGPESRIQGHITARSARIGGQVDGSISAEELVIEASARVTGDVSYQSISIATGGLVDGKMTHMSRAADLKLVGTDAG
ncbi:MAG TPA: polymer-forming cytoskeletal protein [Sphingobium sp.]|nr:polymer-forming cytoskeletal protein [Sphingobium sp.]